MLTDTIINLRNALADLGFPSVLEMPEDASMHDYYTTIADGWAACDQTEEDVDACVRARDAIFNAYNAFRA